MSKKLIQGAKAEKSNLAASWLDLSDACVSISLVLMKRMLSKYHIPEKIQSHNCKVFQLALFIFRVGER